MAYEQPTPAELKAMFPDFVTVDDSTVQLYIDMANRNVDETWLEADYKRAIMSLAAHLMALMGIGKSPEAVAVTGGLAIFQTIKSKDLSLTKFDRPASDNDFWQWSATRYGKLYRALLQLNKGGPRFVRGFAPCVSGYAKDWPL